MTTVILGIDIGGTNSVFGLIDAKGQVIEQYSLPTRQYDSAEALATAIHQTLHDRGCLTNNTISGIGIGAPNGNYYNGTIEFAPNLSWKGIIPLVDIFKAQFNCPVWVTNDANAAAVGEMVYGQTQNCHDFLMVTLGTGVGSGFVSNGKLLYGHDAFAGELGHMIIEPNGRECGCGRRGCLETYASATGIVRTAHQYLEATDIDSSLRQLLPEAITAKDIAEAAASHDQLALDIFDYTADKLAFALANAVTITSPERIILFGGLAKAGNLLLTPLKEKFEAYLLQIFKNKITIECSALPGQNAAVLGAGAIVHQHLNA